MRDPTGMEYVQVERRIEIAPGNVVLDPAPADTVPASSAAAAHAAVAAALPHLATTTPESIVLGLWISASGVDRVPVFVLTYTAIQPGRRRGPAGPDPGPPPAFVRVTTHVIVRDADQQVLHSIAVGRPV